MAGFEVPVELRSVEGYLVQRHGSARELSADELMVLDGWAGQMVADIEDRWPVDTGTSRDSFGYVLLDSPQIGFLILNDADYAEWVHEKGGTPDDPLYLSLIPEVFEDYRADMVAAMRRAIDDTEDRLEEAARRAIPQRSVLANLARRLVGGTAA